MLVSWSVVLLSATAVEAQVLQPPRRVFQRRPDGNRLRQQLTLDANFLGSRDDNVTPNQPAFELPSNLSGYTGFGPAPVPWTGTDLGFKRSAATVSSRS